VGKGPGNATSCIDPAQGTIWESIFNWTTWNTTSRGTDWPVKSRVERIAIPQAFGPYRDPLQNGTFSTAYATQMPVFDVTLLQRILYGDLTHTFGSVDRYLHVHVFFIRRQLSPREDRRRRSGCIPESSAELHDPTLRPYNGAAYVHGQPMHDKNIRIHACCKTTFHPGAAAGSRPTRPRWL